MTLIVFSVFLLSLLLLRNRKKQNAELIRERNFLGFSPEGFISDESPVEGVLD